MSVGGGFLTDILGASLLAAIGLGFGFVTSTIAAVSGVEQHEQGLASGLINTSQQIGGALGLAVLSTIATTRTDDVMATGHSTLPNALTEGFQSAFLGGAVIATAGLRRDAGPDPHPRQQGARRDGEGRVVAARRPSTREASPVGGASQPTSRAGPRRLRAGRRRDWARR